MSQLLDLQVEIAARPPDATPAAAAPITIRCEVLKLKYEGGMFSYPLTKNERNDLRWYLEDYWKWPFEGFAQRGSTIEQLLPGLGQRLYQAVFGQDAARNIVQQWQANTGGAHQISILTTDAGFLGLPWELLHNGQDFLALQAIPPISIVRRIAEEQPSQEMETTFEKPLRVLLVTARPVDEGQLDVRTIAREVLDALQDQIEAGTVELEFLRPPTFDELITRLSDKERPIHVLHFDGHGIFYRSAVSQDGTTEERGRLFFEKEDGKGDPVDATSLAEMLSYNGVRVAVLNACQSAEIGEKDIFSSVAVQVLQGGVQAVVAMSASVLTTSAALYVKSFYGVLAAGGSVQAAHEQAQQVMHEHPERNPLQRSLDEAGKPITLQDWWLPYLYVQRSLALQPVSEVPALRQPFPFATVQHPNSTSSAAFTYAFTGRSAELLQIERSLVRKRVVVLSGFGGVGKTALAREVADWLTRTKMYDNTCFVSFEQGGDVSVLLSTLGNVLAINDGSYHVYDPPSALAILAPLLKQQRIVIIADNVESILPGGDAALDDTGRDQLWEVLTELQRLGAGVLLTSRNVKLDGQRFAPGTQADYLELRGLAPDDAYALAIQVLNANRIDLTSVPYADLCDLLAQLDHHPLAIRLTLPALQSLPLTIVQANFASLLSTFQDDQATGRNRSLLASLDYSLQRLSKEQHALLSRLAPFEGGVLELNLFNVTEMSQDEWSGLRLALEQAGLLVQEDTFVGIKAKFMHFHPVLTPYLRNLPGADDPALHERYVTNYYQFAYYLSTTEQGQRGSVNSRQGEIMRAWARIEFPNLRRSLQLLLKSGDGGLITTTADILVRFLDYFGRWRERDTLRRAVLEAIRPDNTQISETLTWQVYWQEKSLGDQELERGDWQAASRRFQALLFAIETLSENEELGRHSVAQVTMLQRLARALKDGGQFDEAYTRLQEALTITRELLERDPEHKNTELSYILGILLTDSGDVLRNQGQYDEAKQAYEEALQITQDAGDQRSQAVVFAQLGSLALAQKNYAKAIEQYRQARQRFHDLGDRQMEGTVLHQLGAASSDLALMIHGYRAAHIGRDPLPAFLSIESEQAILKEAEQAYRESLKLREQLGDDVEAAGTCFQLGILAERNGRYIEAKNWYMRALDLFERVAPGSRSLMVCLNGLAHLLVNEDYPDRMAHLTEARQYAEQARQMAEKLPNEDMTWTLYRVLATIADLEGQVHEAEAYQRREREVYAEFPAHRVEAEQKYGPFIANVAGAAKGSEQARAQVATVLADFDASEQMRTVAAAIQRILTGERDWHALSSGIVPYNALILRLILESLGVTVFS